MGTYAFVYVICVCEGVCAEPPQNAPLCAVSEAAFLIRGHYMRLVRGSPGRAVGIRDQIRPSWPLTIPRHHGNETRSHLQPPATPLYGGSRGRKRDWFRGEKITTACFLFFSSFVCVYYWLCMCMRHVCLCLCVSEREGKVCVLGIIRGGKWLITWNGPGTENRERGTKRMEGRKSGGK